MKSKPEWREQINEYLRAILEGDSSAFQPLFELTASHLIKIALRILSNKSFAEDVVSEAFMRICHSIHTYNPLRDGYSWMCKIVVNCAKSKNISPAERRNVNIDEIQPPTAKDEISELEGKMVVSKIFEMLDGRDREIAELRYYYDMSIAEIARKLRISGSAVSQRIKKIQTVVEKYIKRD